MDADRALGGAKPRGQVDLLRLARYFVAIVEEGHFGRAAERLGIRQPPLSQALQRLERELGVRLLERASTGLSLTEAGRLLLPRMHRLLGSENELREAARDRVDGRRTLRIGVVDQLPAAASALLARVPADAEWKETALTTAGSVQLVEQVAADRIDVALVVHPVVVGTLPASDVLRVRTDLLVPEEAADHQSATLRGLLTRPLAVAPREHGPSAYDLTADTLASHGVTAGMVEVEDERAALALVAAGRACAVTADPDLRLTGARRTAVPHDALPLRLRAVWADRPGRAGQDVADGMLDVLHRDFRRRGAAG